MSDEAESYQEQGDAQALLASATPLSSIRVVASFRGVTEGEIDAMLAGATGKDGKSAGAIVIVLQPEERPEKKGTTSIELIRRHTIRVIESVKVNRKPSGSYAAGMNADRLKDEVIRRLHRRYLGRASAMLAGVEPFEDGRGGYGWDIHFDVLATLAAETRTAIGGEVAAGTCTLRSESGAAIYYTTDGTPPIPGGATVQTYSAPFAAAADTLIRAAAVVTGKQLSDFLRIVA